MCKHNVADKEKCLATKTLALICINNKTTSSLLKNNMFINKIFMFKFVLLKREKDHCI